MTDVDIVDWAVYVTTRDIERLVPVVLCREAEKEVRLKAIVVEDGKPSMVEVEIASEDGFSTGTACITGEKPHRWCASEMTSTDGTPVVHFENDLGPEDAPEDFHLWIHGNLGEVVGDICPISAPDAEGPRYDPNRPTEEDLEAVRQVVGPVWCAVGYIASRAQVETYVARRACKALSDAGELELKGDGTAMRFRRPAGVQQTLPEPEEEAQAPEPENAPAEAVEEEPRQEAPAQCARRVLADGRWHKFGEMMRAVNKDRESKLTHSDVAEMLGKMARSGAIERYPPVVKGRHANVIETEYRLHQDGEAEAVPGAPAPKRGPVLAEVMSLVSTEWRTTAEIRKEAEKRGFDGNSIASSLNTLLGKGLVERDPPKSESLQRCMYSRWRLIQ